MVLPRPLGPTITMLAACSRKLKSEEFLEQRAIELTGPAVVEVGDAV